MPGATPDIPFQNQGGTMGPWSMGSRLGILAAAMGALSAAAREPAAPAWTRAAEGHAKHRQGATLVWAGDLKKMLLIGDGVEALDPAGAAWTEFSTAKPPGKDGIQPFYQTAYDGKTRKVYCLSLSNVLHVFDVETKTWTSRPPEPLLEGLSWHMLASDGQGRVVAVGSDKKVDNVGWTRTVVLDTAAGRWSPLPLPPEDVVAKHRDLVAASEALIDLVGRIRLAWYRDPRGVGGEDELLALSLRCDALAKLAGMSGFRTELAKVADL